MTEDQIRELFREMREEPVPADSRARVRVSLACTSTSVVSGRKSRVRLAFPVASSSSRRAAQAA